MRGPIRLVTPVLLLLVSRPQVPAQSLPLPYPGEAPPASSTAVSRIRLFGIQPGFINELPWLDRDERTPEAPLPEPPGEDGLDWVSVVVGNDNPYFDLRRRGDPGGVGFARLDSQVQLFDTSRTACSLGLQAVTPLGIEFEGLADHAGPTVVTPALSIFHALDDGTAFQAFVGKNVPLMNATARPVRRTLQYGFGLHRPLSSEEGDPLSSLFVSIGALGQARPAREAETIWQVLPGLHWKPAETWWLSAGYLVPVGPVRTETGGLWQLTCSWQY